MDPLSTQIKSSSDLIPLSTQTQDLSELDSQANILGIAKLGTLAEDLLVHLVPFFTFKEIGALSRCNRHLHGIRLIFLNALKIYLESLDPVTSKEAAYYLSAAALFPPPDPLLSLNPRTYSLEESPAVEETSLASIKNHYPGLEGLYLKGEVTSLTSLPALKQLKRLRLIDCRAFTPETFAPIGLLITLRELRCINCRFPSYSGILSILGNLMHLQELNLSHSQYIQNNHFYTESGIGFIKGLISLTCLNLSRTNFIITPIDLELIGSLTRLQYLNLGGITCNPPLSTTIFRSFNKLTQLTTLILTQWTIITDEHLNSLPYLPSLGTLHLEGCSQLTSACFQSIGKQNCLKGLNIQGITVTNVAYLQGLKGLINLRTLHMTFSTITADTLKSLLKMFPKLTVLNITLNGSSIYSIEKSELDRIRAAYPNVSIVLKLDRCLIS
jgi:hypothetical protein